MHRAMESKYTYAHMNVKPVGNNGLRLTGF